MRTGRVVLIATASTFASVFAVVALVPSSSSGMTPDDVHRAEEERATVPDLPAWLDEVPEDWSLYEIEEPAFAVASPQPFDENAISPSPGVRVWTTAGPGMRVLTVRVETLATPPVWDDRAAFLRGRFHEARRELGVPAAPWREARLRGNPGFEIASRIEGAGTSFSVRHRAWLVGVRMVSATAIHEDRDVARLFVESAHLRGAGHPL